MRITNKQMKALASKLMKDEIDFCPNCLLPFLCGGVKNERNIRLHWGWCEAGYTTPALELDIRYDEVIVWETCYDMPIDN